MSVKLIQLNTHTDKRGIVFEPIEYDFILALDFIGAPGGIRTCGLRIRRRFMRPWI